jgi:hypothetical protein
VNGPELVARCILDNKPKDSNTPTDNVVPVVTPKAAAASTFVERIVGGIQGYLDEYYNPATAPGRKQTIFITAAVIVVGSVLLLVAGGDDEEEG